MSRPSAWTALRLAYVDLLLLSNRLRSGGVPPARVEQVRAWATAQFREQRRTLMHADVPDQTIDDAELAVMALVDESAQVSANRESAELWLAESLQSKRFGHTHLGRDFFVRLEVLRTRPDTPLALLEVYMRCLCLGFEGRYREEDRLSDLIALRESLQADLVHRLGAVPPLAAPLETVQPPPRPPIILPSPAIVGLAMGLVLTLGVLLTGFLYLRAGATQSALLEIAGDKTAEPR